jgi:polysaccharide pyruvyl transferase WcaK-like protein
VLRQLRRLPRLPNRLYRELGALRKMQAEVPHVAAVLEALYQQEIPRLASLLERHVSAEVARALAATAHSSVEITRLAAAVERLSAAEVPQLAAALQRVQADVAERHVMLDHAVRQDRRAAAFARARLQYPAVDRREEGVSVLIPCWNQGDLLEQATGTALAALDDLDAPGEVLILDDASTDRTRVVAERLVQSDPRIGLLVCEENLGVCHTRNLLLSRSRYEHALLLDGDNEVLPQGVRVLYQAARATGAVMTYGNLAARDTQGNVLGVVSNRRASPELIEANYIDALALVRAERLLQLGGFDPDVQHEDWELNVRLLCACELMVFVPTLVGNYRVSTLSISRDAERDPARRRRIQRRHALAGPPAAEDVRAGTYHPATGYLDRDPAEAGPVPVSPESPRILVVSSAGVRSHGDDAILLGTLQRLQRVRPGCVPVVVSDGEDVPRIGRLAVWAATLTELCRSLDPVAIRQGCRSPAQAASLPGRVQAGRGTGTFRPADLASFDVILFSGGGILSRHWPEMVAQRAAVAAAASYHRVPYVVSGQGVGPLGPEVHGLLERLACGACRFGVRDPLSAALLREPPLACTGVDVVGDDSFGLELPDPGRIDRALQEAGVPAGVPLLAFNARTEAGRAGLSEQELSAVAEQVDELAARTGHVVVSVPICSRPWANETELLTALGGGLKRRRARWHLVDFRDDVAVIAALVGRCAAVVTHSYHIGLFALGQNVPTLMDARGEYHRRQAEGLRAYFGLAADITLPPAADSEAMETLLERQRANPGAPLRTPAEVDCWLDQALQAAADESLAARPPGEVKRFPELPGLASA